MSSSMLFIFDGKCLEGVSVYICLSLSLHCLCALITLPVTASCDHVPSLQPPPVADTNEFRSVVGYSAGVLRL